MASEADADDPFDAFVSAASSSSIEPAKNGNTKVDFSSEESDFFNQKVGQEKKLDKESILKIFDSSAPVINNSTYFFNQPPQTAWQPNAFAAAPAPSSAGLVPRMNPIAFQPLVQPNPLVAQAFNGLSLTGNTQPSNFVASSPVSS